MANRHSPLKYYIFLIRDHHLCCPSTHPSSCNLHVSSLVQLRQLTEQRSLILVVVSGRSSLFKYNLNKIIICRLISMKILLFIKNSMKYSKLFRPTIHRTDSDEPLQTRGGLYRRVCSKYNASQCEPVYY